MYFKIKDLNQEKDLSREEWTTFVEEQKDLTDQWQDAWTEVARDRVHNLDLSISEHQDIYNSTLRTHIMFGEVNWNFENGNTDQFSFTKKKNKSFQIPTKPIINLKSYLDTKDLKTIGIGFNMNSSGAKAEWEAALGKDVLFSNDKEVKTTITKVQAYKLFDYSIKIREKKLKKKFGTDWDLLKPNEKITITSMYYNLPGLIGPKFTENIKQYIKTNDKKYLEKAFSDVKYQSNAKKDKKGNKKKVEERVAVQKRMDREAAMLESYKCPLYSKPEDKAIPDNASMKIKPGETIIPRIGELEINEEELDDDGKKKQYEGCIKASNATHKDLYY